MKDGKSRLWAVLGLTVLGCVLMALIEGGLRPIYPVKSALKAAVFLGCALGYVGLTGDRDLFRAFGRPGRAALLPGMGLGLGVVIFLLGGYALLSPWLDLSAVTENLGAKEGIGAETFPLVACYITFCNSMLEEFFFRAFAFLTLLRLGYQKLAYIFSALAFALYHVAILDGWFHPALLVLLTAGLVVAGLLLDWLDREGTVWPAWLVHMGANLAINLIGMRLFGIL